MVKLSAATCFVVLAFTSLSVFGEETPTCRWLHLDQDTRVYQCAVLPPEIEADTGLVAEALPDPTVPLDEQQISEPQKFPTLLSKVQKPVALKAAGGIPEFLRESVPPVTETTNQKDTAQNNSPQNIAVVAIEAPDAARAKMRIHGDDHFYLLPKSQQLSVGVYSTEKAAKLRQQTLQKMGVLTELRFRERLPVVAGSKPQVNEFRAVKVVRVEESPIVQRPGLSQPTNTVSGYLVATIGDQNELVLRLKQLNATDFVVLKAEPYRGRVSLGVYSNYANALARQDYFKSLGIDSDLISRNESMVVRTTVPKKNVEEIAPYGFDQIALRPLEI
tara:strand:- start:3897 stop:4892 length:996 start_codon:yes stop_codon:yes gene_type:complete